MRADHIQVRRLGIADASARARKIFLTEARLCRPTGRYWSGGRYVVEQFHQSVDLFEPGKACLAHRRRYAPGEIIDDGDGGDEGIEG